MIQEELKVIPGMALTDEVRAILPSNCLKCEWHQTAKHWNIPPEEDDRDDPELENAPWILIMGFHPGQVEDEECLHMINPNGGGGFLRTFLAELDCRWILDQIVGCFGGRDPVTNKDKKPLALQVQACSSFRAPVILDPRVKVIVCVGADAMKGVMGKNSPKSISAAGKAPIMVEGLPPILVTYHPIVHVNWERNPRDGQNLTEEYVRVFSLASDIANGRYQKTEVSFQETSNPDQAIKWFQAESTTNRVYFDCEVAFNESDPVRKTIWHPGAKLLCVSFTFSQVDESYKTYVIYGSAMVTQVFRVALSGRWCGAWNLNFDALCLYIFAGFNLFEEARECCCLMVDYYIREQSVKRIDLKSVGQEYLNTEDWGSAPWLELDALSKRQLDGVKLINEINRKRRDTKKKWGIWYNRLLTSKKALPPPKTEMQPEYPAEEFWYLIQNGEKNLTDQAHEFFLRTLDEVPLPEKNLLDFRNLNQPELRKYCATDTWVTARLGEEALFHEEGVKIVGTDPPDPIIRELMRRSLWTLSEVEREGLPCDEQELQSLKSYYERLIAETRLKLFIEYPDEIHPILAKRKGCSIETLSLADAVEINPNAPTFYEPLVRNVFVVLTTPQKPKNVYRISVPWIDSEFLKTLFCLGKAVKTTRIVNKKGETEVVPKSWDVNFDYLDLIIKSAEEIYGADRIVDVDLTVSGGLSSSKATFLRLARMFAPQRNHYAINGWREGLSEEELQLLENKRGRLENLFRDLFYIKHWSSSTSKDIGQYIDYIVDGRIHSNYRLAKGSITSVGQGAEDVSGGASTGRLCVAKGTPINMPRDFRNYPDGIPIEDVRAGDYVYSYDYYGTPSVQKVLWTGQTGVKPVMRISWKGQGNCSPVKDLLLTAEHEVRLFDGNWLPAKELKPGDPVMSWMNIQIVSVEETDLVVPVYDLEVENTHCFIASQIAVHNSSSDPNLQNLKTDNRLRRCFPAPEGWSIVELDFSQIEPMCLAVVADIPAWKEIFRRGQDPYRWFCNQVDKMGVDIKLDDDTLRQLLLEKIPKPRRDLYKQQVLAVMYERGPRSFAAVVGISYDEAVAFFEEFDRAYPEINKWKEQIRETVYAGKPVLSLFGRRRTFSLEGLNAEEEAAEIRSAINHPIQSLASDINLWLQYEVLKEIAKRGWRQYVKIFNLIHDSCWVLIRNDYLHRGASLIKSVMEDNTRLPFEFDLQLKTEGKLGTNLGDMSTKNFDAMMKSAS